MTNAPEQRTLSGLPLFGASSDPAAVQVVPPAPQRSDRGTETRSPGQHLLAAAGRQQPPLPPTSAPAPAPASAPAQDEPSPSTGEWGEGDWDLVAQLRVTVANNLANAAGADMSDADRRELARTHIAEAISAHIDRVVRESGDSTAWTSERRHAISKAVFDSVFGIGRLQPLIEEEGIENIHIIGHDTVIAFYADGRIEAKPPVARSDAELLEELQFIAGHVNGTENSRPFSASDPQLDLDLPGGARMTATAPPIEPRPSATIRVHRFVDVTLASMSAVNRTLTPPAVLFLQAAVRASRRIVVAGAPGTGKTTLMRALCNSIDPFEPIVTIEKEYELYLDRMGDRHHLVYAMQHRQGQGERLPDGTTPGEVNVVRLFDQGLRKDTRRFIVGEARTAEEIEAMFQAFQTGVGGMCTIHAESASDTIGRIARLAMRTPGVTRDGAYEEIGQDIDLIVHMDRILEDGRFRRIVTEIAEVQAGEEGKPPVAHAIFRANPATHDLEAVGRPTARLLDRLVAAGLDESKSLLPGGDL